MCGISRIKFHPFSFLFYPAALSHFPIAAPSNHTFDLCLLSFSQNSVAFHLTTTSVASGSVQMLDSICNELLAQYTSADDQLKLLFSVLGSPNAIPAPLLPQVSIA